MRKIYKQHERKHNIDDTITRVSLSTLRKLSEINTIEEPDVFFSYRTAARRLNREMIYDDKGEDVKIYI